MAKGVIFAKTDILAVLNIINGEYMKALSASSAKNNRLLKTYSKMAVITAGGWVEDGIKSLMEISGTKLRNVDGQKRLEHLSKRISGFSYERHFSRGVMYAFGAHGLEFIEKQLGQNDLIQLGSSLGNLKKWRDDAAHSHAVHIKATPSIIIKEIGLMFPILKNIESSARKYKNKYF